MSGLLSRLGIGLDTWGGRAKMGRFRGGWPSRTSADIKFHRADLVQYRYRDVGSGPTIIFTADPPMTLENYDALIAAFAPRFRVVVVELPAMGFSAAAPGYGFGFRETNDSLAAFVRDVGGAGSILAFSCAASLAALDIAHRSPELVSRLCLIQGGGVAAFARWKAGRDPKGILARPLLGQMAMKRMAPRRMPQWYRLSVGRKDQVDHFCACADTAFRNGAMWSLASAYQLYMNQTDELPQPHQPILSIWGDADRSHPADNAHSLAGLYDNVSCVTLAGLGHTPELEDPAQVFAAITAFLDGQ
ncbi:MAG: hypothetical protein RLZZ58_2241 [Pseudomonadota bacterium]